MADREIDSFVRKFKILCEAGRSASLTVSSNAGKAVINLRVDLGVLGEPDDHPHHSSQRRFGPSQQRRRERRAAARQAAAEQAEASLYVEEKDVLKKAEVAETECNAEKAVKKAEVKLAGKVNENPVVEEIEITEQVVHNEAATKEDTVVDEFCSNASFDSGKSTATASPPPPPSRPSRGLGSVDYDAMRFEDFLDDIPRQSKNKSKK